MGAIFAAQLFVWGLLEPTGELHLVGHVSASGSPSLPACSRISVSQCQNVGAFHRGIAVGVVPPRGAQCLGLALGVGSTSHPLAATRQDAGMGLGLTGGCRQGAGLGLGLSFGSQLWVSLVSAGRMLVWVQLYCGSEGCHQASCWP